MAYLCEDRSGEYIADNCPIRDFCEWKGWENTDCQICKVNGGNNCFIPIYFVFKNNVCIFAQNE